MTPDHLATLIANAVGAAIGPAVEQAVTRAFATESGQKTSPRPTNHLRLVPGGQAARKPKRREPGGAA